MHTASKGLQAWQRMIVLRCDTHKSSLAKVRVPKVNGNKRFTQKMERGTCLRCAAVQGGGKSATQLMEREETCDFLKRNLRRALTSIVYRLDIFLSSAVHRS